METEAKRTQWAREFFATIDRMDSPGFAAYFAETGSFRMGNAPAYVGRAAIEEFVRGFFGAIRGIRHQHLGMWESGPATLFTEGEVFYTVPSGAVVTHPYLGVMEFDGDLIRSYRAYVDPAPLVAALHSEAVA